MLISSRSLKRYLGGATLLGAKRAMLESVASRTQPSSLGFVGPGAPGVNSFVYPRMTTPPPNLQKWIRRMKLLAPIIALALLAVVASAETQVRRDGTYEYDKDELRWDKKAFDSPPQIVGGYADLVRRISYPSELRASRVEDAATTTVALDATGQVTSVTFAPRMPRDLERIVTAAVRGCRWKPGQKQGRAVGGRVWFPVEFKVRSS